MVSRFIVKYPLSPLTLKVIELKINKKISIKVVLTKKKKKSNLKYLFFKEAYQTLKYKETWLFIMIASLHSLGSPIHKSCPLCFIFTLFLQKNVNGFHLVALNK